MLLAFLLFETIRLGAFPDEGGSTAATFLHNLLLTHSLGFVPSLGWNYPSWSISAELVAYLAFAALAVLVPRRLGPVLAAIALGGLGFLLLRLGHIEAHVDFGWLRCLAGFAIGAFLRLRLWDGLRLDPRPDRASRWTWAELATVAYVALFVSLYGTSALSVAAPLVFAAAIFVFAHEGGAVSRALKTRPFALLGLLSYSIYMTHAFVIARVTNAATLAEKRLGWSVFVEVSPGTKVLAESLTGELVVLLVLVGGTLILSALTWRFVEKPGQAIGHALAARRRVGGVSKRGSDALPG
jgi:peptidoglycan/LPS O-acetylase OafA/YrhL